LQADCTRCCGLCCVAPAFDAEQGFGFDKPAHTACVNLRTDFRCAIHHQLRSQGFPACSTFDCYGAGQRVTQQLYGGRDWLAQPELAARMFEAYSRYRALHELMALLEAAAAKAAPPERLQIQKMQQTIDALCDSGAAAGGTVRVAELRRSVLSRLRALLSAGAARPGSTANPQGLSGS